MLPRSKRKSYDLNHSISYIYLLLPDLLHVAKLGAASELVGLHRVSEDLFVLSGLILVVGQHSRDLKLALFDKIDVVSRLPFSVEHLVLDGGHLNELQAELAD